MIMIFFLALLVAENEPKIEEESSSESSESDHLPPPKPLETFPSMFPGSDTTTGMSGEGRPCAAWAPPLPAEEGAPGVRCPASESRREGAGDCVRFSAAASALPLAEAVAIFDDGADRSCIISMR